MLPEHTHQESAGLTKLPLGFPHTVSNYTHNKQFVLTMELGLYIDNYTRKNGTKRCPNIQEKTHIRFQVTSSRAPSLRVQLSGLGRCSLVPRPGPTRGGAWGRGSYHSWLILVRPEDEALSYEYHW